MKNIIAIGGEPATGKTTLMWKLIDSADDWKVIEPEKTLNAIRSDTLNTTILGKYERSEMFAGTDRLSMSVQPLATKFIQEAKGNVIFEGDRLFNRKFIDAIIACSCPFSLIYLEASQNTLDERHVSRNDSQSKTFLNSRRTKYSNIIGGFDLIDVLQIFQNETPDDSNVIYEFIRKRMIK